MAEQKKPAPLFADYIEGKVFGDEKQILLDFEQYCKANKMPVKWNEHMFSAYYKGKRVAVLKFHDDTWGIHTCYLNYSSPDIETFIKNNNFSEIIWKNVKYCVSCKKNCTGAEKNIAGRVFGNVCVGGTTVIFNNIDDKTLDCVKQLMEIRKNNVIAEMEKKAK